MKKNRQHIYALGEVLWDIFEEKATFGGAPANFACACATLSHGMAKVYLGTAIGNDEMGQSAWSELQAHKVFMSVIQKNSLPTGHVHVKLSSEGKASYKIPPEQAWDHIALDAQFLEIKDYADVLYFGTLAQRSDASRNTIQTLLKTAPKECLKVLDLNLRSPFWSEEIIHESLQLANVVKLNDEELPLVANMLAVSGSIEGQLQAILTRYHLNLIAYTRGPNGAIMMNSKNERSETAGETVEVVDTIGAGDAFTAAMVVGLLMNKNLENINKFANRVAAYFCTQPGGTPFFNRTLFPDYRPPM